MWRSTRLVRSLRSASWQSTAFRRQVGRGNGSAACVSCADQITGLLRSCPETGAKDLLRALPAQSREDLIANAIEEIGDSELDRIVSRLDGETQRAMAVAALSRHFGQDFRNVFQKSDKDSSGDLSSTEFRRYLQTVVADSLTSDCSPPTTNQLVLVFIKAAIPNIIFGMLDNSIMIVGGDVVDDMIGSTFHLSSLACAAWANTFADCFGITVGSSVERFTSKLGMPQANLSPEQVQLPIVRRISMLAGPVGILIGCIIGMAPLLFRDEEKRAIAVAFARADADGNGSLSGAEVVQALRAFHASRGEDIECTPADLKHFDTNAMGKIDLASFTAGYRKLSAK